MKEEEYWVDVNNQKMLKVWSEKFKFLLLELEKTEHIKGENLIFEGIFREHNRFLSFKIWYKVIENRVI
jgi:hypothetical protein